MSKSSKTKLEYMARYESTPAEIKKREERNKARYDAIRDGKVKKGDNLEIDHKRMLDQGGSNAASNQRVVTASENRGWRGKHPEVYGKGKK